MTLPKHVLNALIGLLVIAQTTTAQTSRISGLVSNGTEPIPFATVVLKKALDSSVVKVEYSDTSGQFAFPQIPFGSYFLETSQHGMVSDTLPPFEVHSAQVSLDKVILRPNAITLASTTVTVQRPLIQVEADKTVFNVQGTINAAGNDGFELLRKAPGVIIDNNNNVILEGKSGVLFYIDGKPSPLAGDDLINYLRSLQASDIDAIEIITQPSSKYDAAGNAGIINIKLVKDKRLGTNGTITAGFAQGHNTRVNSSISLNNRNKKTNLFGGYNNHFGTSWGYINIARIQEGVEYAARSETLTDMNVHNARLGFDVFPNSKHTVGILLDANFNDMMSNGLSRTTITPLDSSSAQSILVADNVLANDNYNLSGNLNYMFADTSGHELNIDLDYGMYNRAGNNYQPNVYTDTAGDTLSENNHRMITPTDIQIASAKADYVQNALKGKLGIGAKVSRVVTHNIFEFYDVMNGTDELNEDRSNVFDYTEAIAAAYVNFQRTWKKTSIQLGLRAEQTMSEGNLSSTQASAEDSVKRSYLDLFPSGGITYNLAPMSAWALTYSRRIQRPNYQSLNPFENQIDELSFQKGNPFLQPQYTNNVKLSHTYRYTLTTGISYSYVRDFFAQITDTLGPTKSYLSTRNIADQTIWSFTLSYPFQIKPWWSVYLSINAYTASYRATDEKFYPITQHTVSGFGQSTFLLPHGFKLELSSWFSSPSVWGGSFLTKSMGSLDVAVQKRFLKERLTARMSYSDLLGTAYWRAEMKFGDLEAYGDGGWDAQVFRVNLSYMLGSNQVKGSRKRSTGSEEEEQRIGEDGGQPGQ